MKKLTAYNADIQKYMQQNRLSTQKKYEIIDAIRKRFDDTTQSFESLFPSRSKRKDVMDHIIYLLSGNGICKISAETLADKADCSVRTVTTTVRALKQTGEILVAGLADGKNKYVFVLKTHPNFTTIMKKVFYIDAEQNANQIAEQKNHESLEAVSLEGEKTNSNYNNPINPLNIINKRNSIQNNSMPEENMQQPNFVAHWVPKRFVSLTSAFYSKATTIQEFWKVIKQCNRVVNHTTGKTAFDKEQELLIGVQAMKEFAMKIKGGVRMKKGKFAYFNGIVNNLMDKYYFDPAFSMT
ncbi:HTH domain-containing protein [Bacillus cereus]|nr:HTH domain-containing protein [Bacillus cereus]MEB8666229.1 HTH domain-containing protein [Bacillus cereus]